MICEHRDLQVMTHSCPTRRSSDLVPPNSKGGEPVTRGEASDIRKIPSRGRTITQRKGVRDELKGTEAINLKACFADQETAAPKLANRSPGSSWERRQVIAIGRSFMAHIGRRDRKSTRLNSSH